MHHCHIGLVLLVFLLCLTRRSLPCRHAAQCKDTRTISCLKPSIKLFPRSSPCCDIYYTDKPIECQLMGPCKVLEAQVAHNNSQSTVLTDFPFTGASFPMCVTRKTRFVFSFCSSNINSRASIEISIEPSTSFTTSGGS